MSNDSGLKRKFIPTDSSQFNPFKKFKSNLSQEMSCEMQVSNSQCGEGPLTFHSASGKFIPTMPQPFNLKTEQRSRKTSCKPTEDLDMQIESRPKFKAKPVPKFPPVPEPIRNNRFTVSQPFGLSSDSKSRINSNPPEEKPKTLARQSCSFTSKIDIKKGNNAVSSNFYSENPPRFDNIFQPTNYRFEALPLPDFYSNYENRSKSRTEEDRPENFKFTARPMPNFEKVFVPVTNSVSTQPLDIELNSSRRAVEREKFENVIKDKENFKKEQEMLKFQMETEEIKLYRRSLEFKARPLQELKPFYVKRSEEQLTTPRSPVLHTKMRALQRSTLENSMSEYMDIDP